MPVTDVGSKSRCDLDLVIWRITGGAIQQFLLECIMFTRFLPLHPDLLIFVPHGHNNILRASYMQSAAIHITTSFQGIS